MNRRTLLAALLLLLIPNGVPAARGAQAAREPAGAATGAVAAPAPAIANPDNIPVPEYRLSDGQGDRSLLWDGSRAAASFGIVLVLLAVGVKALRRWPGLAGRVTAAGPLQVVGRLPLGAKESVCLVRVGHEALVVGVSGAGVSLLHRMDAGALEASPIGAGHLPAVGSRPASARLRALAARIQDVQAAWGFGHPPQKGTS